MFERAIPLLNNAKKIAVFTHINPDGDALGSSIAFKLGLEQMGKSVDLFCDDVIHENYFFLNTQTYYVKHQETNYDLAVILDASDLARLGAFSEMYYNISKKLVIDHHLNNEIKADVSIIDLKAGSVGVLIYRLFNELKLKLNKDIATALYTAISTDTGCFMHNNTTSEAHIITAKLMEFDIDLEKANYFLFNRKTKSQIQLLHRALNQLQFHENNKIVMVIIRQTDFLETNTTYEDTIGILNTIRGIDGVDLSMLLTETQKDCYKVSLRSYNVNASNIANHFNGGGHKHA
ncbi:MAG: hypothetical protein CVV59_02045, partial [Tenericutes bacterium HGW-Tenericutes-4]